MLPGPDNGTNLENLTFLHALESWCKEREAYPSFLEVHLPKKLSAGMPIYVAAKPQNNGDISYVESPRHVLIRENLTPSTIDRLTTVLQGIQDQQGLVFRAGLFYITQLYLVLYDLERMQASKKSMLSPHGYQQREEPQSRTLSRFSRLWSLDDVLQFWERFDGQLNRGFLPPKDSHRGWWSYDTIPPCWFPYTEDVSPCQCYSLPFTDKNPSPPSVPIMVPAPWKNWVENLVALLQVPAQHGVHINISLGAVVAENPDAYGGEKRTIHIGLSDIAEENLIGSVREYSSALNIFRNDGDHWSITYKGQQLPPMRHRVGFSYISLLLQHR
jgi:hypothetical protein